LEYSYGIINFVCCKIIKLMSKKIVKYEDEETISIWTYDFDKFKNGPISVERIEKKPEPIKKKRK